MTISSGWSKVWLPVRHDLVMSSADLRRTIRLHAFGTVAREFWTFSEESDAIADFGGH